MRHRTIFAALILAACLRVLAVAAADDPVAAMLSKKALAGAYNPVLLDFLLEEGKTRLSAA
jgi:hypothetical protein